MTVYDLDILINGILNLKKMISLLSDVNKRSIYKNYPMRSYVDPNSLIEYAKSFKNIKVINENFDFRYVSS